MIHSSPRRQRLERIEALRARAATLKERQIHESIRDEICELEIELDDARESLTQGSVDYRLHIVLPIADSIIENASLRVATIEQALEIDPRVQFRSQLAADE
jgi:hypothetical protein